MRNEWIIAVTGACLLGMGLWLMALPAGATTAGLSLGFTAPLSYRSIPVVLGLSALPVALLTRAQMLLPPLGFLLSLFMGGLLSIDRNLSPTLPYLVFVVALPLALLIRECRRRSTLVALLLLASLGFHLGLFLLRDLPAYVFPPAFLAGAVTSLALILAIAVAFYTVLLGDHEESAARLRALSVLVMRWLG